LLELPALGSEHSFCNAAKPKQTGAR